MSTMTRLAGNMLSSLPDVLIYSAIAVVTLIGVF